MRLKSVFCIFLVGLMAFSSAAQPSDTRWIAVKGWEWLNLRWDKESASRIGRQKIKIWYLIDLLDEQKQQMISEGIIKSSEMDDIKEGKHGVIIDCKNRTYAFFAISWVNSSGVKVNGADFAVDQMRYRDIPPDSPWEGMAKDACNRVR